MNPQQPRVCARHTYPRMQGKPHVDSHLHVMHSPPQQCVRMCACSETQRTELSDMLFIPALLPTACVLASQ